MDDARAEDLRDEYRRLINDVLPSEIQSPIRFNHCFARVVLDWLFGDIWYDHVDRPAYRHLTAEQLARCVDRMNLWRHDHAQLVADNEASLSLRRAAKAAAHGPRPQRAAGRRKELPHKDLNLD